VCQSNLGGSIDPNPFRAPDGTLYLQWKSDNNRFGDFPTTLWTRQLTADGLSFPWWSRTNSLLSADASWEHNIIEGPAMTAVARPSGGYWYFLMYGAGNWTSDQAGIGYAVCSGPLGPCTKVTTRSPWITTGTTGTGGVGQAGPSFYTLGSSSPYATTQQLAYHGWFCPPGATCPNPPTGYSGPSGPVRALWINTIGFSSGSPILAGSAPAPRPTTTTTSDQ
jgi:hypothetical protein